MTTERILYANPVILATDTTNLILSSKKTETHTVPFIPADCVKPLQVAVVNSTNALVTALNLWTQYESDDAVEAEMFDKLAKFFSDIRTKYLQAQAKSQELSEQKAASHE